MCIFLGREITALLRLAKGPVTQFWKYQRNEPSSGELRPSGWGRRDLATERQPPRCTETLLPREAQGTGSKELVPTQDCPAQ